MRDDKRKTLELNKRAKWRSQWRHFFDMNRVVDVEAGTTLGDIVMVALFVSGAITVSVALTAGLWWVISPFFPK